MLKIVIALGAILKPSNTIMTSLSIKIDGAIIFKIIKVCFVEIIILSIYIINALLIASTLDKTGFPCR
ncbi:hypothetical protein A7456_10030 [Moraxella nonliquefaciens]|uniref:Uncharacterized protein n=1 Tax=Moraxella nonliquefaciens TaxID=478 RepID=A0A1B8QNW6_MORNO|nr:hypothetical protein A7456_10030 [Moraxella nonliquefaciens]